MKIIFGVLLVLAIGVAACCLILERASTSRHSNLKQASENERNTKISLALVGVLLIAFLTTVTESLLGFFAGLALATVGYFIFGFFEQKKGSAIYQSKRKRASYIIPLVILLGSVVTTGLLTVQAQNKGAETKTATKTSSAKDNDAEDKGDADESSESSSEEKSSKKNSSKSKSKPSSSSKSSDKDDAAETSSSSSKKNNTSSNSGNSNTSSTSSKK